MVRANIKKLIDAVIPSCETVFDCQFPSNVNYKIEKPKNADHGDFSVDLAFQLSKNLKQPPFVIAEKMSVCLRKFCEGHPDEYGCITSITVAKPGFINFTLSVSVWHDLVRTIRNLDEEFGNSHEGQGRKVLLEYVSANPTGPLTIAHGRQACLGDTLANVMNTAGYEVFREYYLNDGGRQIRILGESVRARYLELLNVDCEFPEEGYKGEYIRDIAQAVIDEKGGAYKESSPEEALPFFSDFAAHYLMREIETDLTEVDVHFDNYFSEKSLQGEAVNSVLKELEDKSVLFEKDGALWFSSTTYGDDKDRVLRKTDGSFTYLVPDIAYHKNKYDRGYDHVINLLGPDHHGYIKRLKASVEALGFNPDQLTVLIVQLTTLYKNGEPYRMSTRSGDFISLRQLIDEVGKDATRFFFLMRKINSHLDFDLELAKEKSQDNPVFYLQYAHARICNIIKYAERDIKAEVNLGLLTEDEELALIKRLHEYPHLIDIIPPFVIAVGPTMKRTLL